MCVGTRETLRKKSLGAVRNILHGGLMRYMCGADTGNRLSMRFTPKGPRTQIIGSQGPNTITLMVFGP